MSAQDWRALGVFAVLLIGLSFVDARLAWWLVAALAAVVLIRNSGKLAAIANRIQG